MKLADKAKRIQGILDELYPAPPIPLDHTDPYTLLVAVLLSAQCTDKKVNETTPKLFARAKTPQAMVKLTPEAIREIIKPCGLSPAKSKAIHGLSKLLLEKHGGRVPRTFEELEALPGVGHKTASVVMIHAFRMPAFPVDTHIHRLAARWGLSDGSSVERTERDVKALFPESAWERLHLQWIYFGREHCPALRHDLGACPICSWAASKELLAAAKAPKLPRARPKR
ncbi:MAG: endonuclease III [Planctomycetes bacterium]|nr:endonuclease III [Planctomycetota bacterium]